MSKNPNVLRMVRDGEAFDQLARVVRRQEMEEAGQDPFVEHAPGKATSEPQGRRTRAQWSTPTCTQIMPPKGTFEARLADPKHQTDTGVNLVEQLARQEFRRQGGFVDEEPRARKRPGFWATPVANEERASKYSAETSLRHFEEGTHQAHLSQMARDKRMHPTPTSLNGLRSSSESEHRPGKWQSPGHPEYGELSPEWVEWLMGWPIGWTSLEPMDPAAFAAWERMQAGEPGQSGWWLDDPSDASESGVTKTVPKPDTKEAEKARQSRIAALGNGQASACAAAAFMHLWGQPDPEGA